MSECFLDQLFLSTKEYRLPPHKRKPPLSAGSVHFTNFSYSAIWWSRQLCTKLFISSVKILTVITQEKENSGDPKRLVYFNYYLANSHQEKTKHLLNKFFFSKTQPHLHFSFPETSCSGSVRK